jgi:hypothetical protein
MGRGPPYTRNPDLERVAPRSVWVNARRIDERMQETDGTDKRIVLAKSEQAYYALGLLSVEQDLDRLVLKETG